MISPGSVLRIGAYQKQCSFSHLPRFSDFVTPFLKINYNSVNDAKLDIEDVISSLEKSISWPLKQDLDFLKINVIGDLKQILRSFQSVKDKEVFNENLIETQLRETLNKGIGLLRKVNLKIDTPNLYLVDELPTPYNLSGYAAMAADQGDFEIHGIEPGVYFLKSKLRPIYSEFILLHELTHVALGKKSPDLLGRGLEEGFAELLGAMFLSSKVLGENISRNLFIYNRLSFGFNHFWEMYLDYTRMANHIFNTIGIKGVVEIINSGRDEVKKVENALLLGKKNILKKYHKGNFDAKTKHIIDDVTLNFGRNLVVSPGAKYISSFVKKGMTMNEICTLAKVDLKKGKELLKELQTKIYICQFRDDDVTCTFNDCDFISKHLRYEI